MANRHSGDFFWIGHNGDSEVSHNGEKTGGGEGVQSVAANPMHSTKDFKLQKIFNYMSMLDRRICSLIYLERYVFIYLLV